MGPLLLVTTLALVAQAQAPPLPPLALAAFPESARDRLTRLHREASTRPDDARAVGTLGQWLHAWEQWDSAHQAYARAQALDPQKFDWHYLDAVVLQRMGQHDAAAARLERGLVLNPAYLPARVKLAEVLFETGDVRRSKSLFEALATEATAAPAAQLGLGRIAAAQGRHEAAIAHLERAVALFPEFGAAHYALVRLYRAAGRAADAALALERHARYGPRWPAIADPLVAAVSGLRQDALAVLQKGVRSAAAGDIEAAIASHEAALRLDPSLVQAHANLLSLYGRVRNWARADTHYRAAVAAGYQSAVLHYDYGVVLGLQEKWDAAEAEYRRAIALNPLHAQARNNLGQLLERQQKLDEAAAEYQRAVDSQPTLRIARFNLGRMLLAKGRNEEAIAEFANLTEPRDAEAPRYLFALATAHARAGHRADAVKWATEAKMLAERHGDTALAAAIERDLARIR